MPVSPANSRRFPALLVIAAAAASFCAAGNVLAQPAPASVPADYDIPAGPLSNALTRFAQQSGVSIAVDADRVRGLRTEGLRGRFGVEDGFNGLLRGTGYAIARAGSGYVLVAAPTTIAAPASATPGAPAEAPRPAATTPPTLPVVTVRASVDQETAWGPANGFVATRSATGTKSDTPLIETPQSITVITSEQIAALAAQSVAQTLRYAGGVTSEPRGTMTALDFFYTRGFALNQYLDGLKTLNGGYSLPQPDPYLLERVEVLRGPASVLYGQADPGGVLNLVSKRPTDKLFGDAEIQFGNQSRKQLGIDVGAPLDARGTLTGRVTMIARDADTQVDFARQQRVAIAPSLTWKPDTATTLTLLGSYQNDPKVGYYNWTPAYGTVLPNPTTDQKLPTNLYTGEPSYDQYKRETYALSEILEHRFNDTFLLRQSLRYAHVKAAFDNVYSSFLDSDFQTLNRYAWHLRDRLDAVTADQHLQTTFRTGEVGHTMLTGLDVQYSRYRQQLGYNFASGTGPGEVPPINIYAPVYGLPIATPEIASDGIQKSQQIGVYVQDQLAIGKWRLLLGGRKDWSRSTTDESLSATTSEQRDNAFTGRAGVVYLLDNGLAPYASYSESFVPTPGADFSGNLFKPTKGRQYEVGIKYQPAATNAFAMLSLFDLTQSNVLSTDFAHPGNSIQTGAIRSRGIELSGVLSLSSKLDLTAAISHVKQVVTEGGVDFGPAVGKRPATLPATTASLWASYGGELGFGFGLGARYVGSSYGDDDNSFTVPAHTLADAEVHYNFSLGESKGWRVALNVSNLFDKVFVSSCGGTDFCAYGDRRTWLATLGKRW